MCKCTPQIRTPFCGKGNCVAPNMQSTPVYRIGGERGVHYYFEKNGMPMSAADVLAELEKKTNVN